MVRHIQWHLITFVESSPKGDYWGMLMILFVPNLALHCYCKATYEPHWKCSYNLKLCIFAVLVLCNHLKLVECLRRKINLGSSNTNYLILEMLKLSNFFFSGNKKFVKENIESSRILDLPTWKLQNSLIIW
jgi:hypothetical protein